VLEVGFGVEDRTSTGEIGEQFADCYFAGNERGGGDDGLLSRPRPVSRDSHRRGLMLASR